MAKTGFFKITTPSGREINELVSKFSHELATEQDNLLVLEINEANKDLIDDEDFKEGTILTFHYGFFDGKVSQSYVARIADVIPNYGDIITITIRCTDLGIVMKKGGSKKMWQNIKTSDIVKQIALANGLKAVVDATTTVHTSMPQGGKSDYDFLKYLESIEKDGSMRFFLRGDEIHFTRLQLEAPSKKTFTYKDGDGSVKRFRPYSRETIKDAAARNTVVTSVDPFTNKPVQTVINSTTAKDDVKLGDFVYDFNAVQIGYGKSVLSGGKSTLAGQRPSQIQKAQNDPSKTGQHIYTPSNSLEASNVGNKHKKKKALADYEAQLTIEGDPDLVEDIVITMSNVAKKDLGNWYVSRVTHSIDSASSYETRATMYKNAGKKPIGDGTKQSNVNNTKGITEKQDTTVTKPVKVYIYNKDGNQVN